MEIVLKGRGIKNTGKKIRYATSSGDFYVPISDLQAAGCTKSPGVVYITISDQEPEGFVERESQAEFEL